MPPAPCHDLNMWGWRHGSFTLLGKFCLSPQLPIGQEKTLQWRTTCLRRSAILHYKWDKPYTRAHFNGRKHPRARRKQSSCTRTHLIREMFALRENTGCLQTSPVATGEFARLSSPKHSTKPSQIEIWNTISQCIFIKFWCQALPHKRKAPLLTTIWRRFCFRQ